MKRLRPINEKLYRDPVHGIVALDKSVRSQRLLLQLIDAAEVQRLRRIRQLGLAYMVYQGAEHSRFTHVIGVMHLMGVVLKQLAKGYKIEKEDILVGQCAGLLTMSATAPSRTSSSALPKSTTKSGRARSSSRPRARCTRSSRPTASNCPNGSSRCCTNASTGHALSPISFRVSSTSIASTT